MRSLTIAVLLFLFAGCAKTQQPTQETKALAQPTPSKVQFNAEMLDKTIDPCVDFYAYACKKWQAANPIPGDESGWGRFNELEERGEYTLRDILQKYSSEDPKRSVVEQKIGDYYQSCMDESAIEKAGTQPLAKSSRP